MAGGPNLSGYRPAPTGLRPEREDTVHKNRVRPRDDVRLFHGLESAEGFNGNAATGCALTTSASLLYPRFVRQRIGSVPCFFNARQQPDPH